GDSPTGKESPVQTLTKHVAALQTRVSRLEKDIPELMQECKERLRLGITRQIALNIEFEIKMDVLRAMESSVGESAVLEFKSRGAWHRRTISRAELDEVWDLVRAFSEELAKRKKEKWFGGGTGGVEKEKDFQKAMWSLKELPRRGAHPTTYNKGAQVQARLAREIVNNHLEDGYEKEVAMEFLVRLRTIREAAGEDFLQAL
ncbi:hypothetical protein HK104_004855, partial [Borealophlyctis nickersoniae]